VLIAADHPPEQRDVVQIGDDEVILKGSAVAASSHGEAIVVRDDTPKHVLEQTVTVKHRSRSRSRRAVSATRNAGGAHEIRRFASLAEAGKMLNAVKGVRAACRSGGAALRE
jgi:hypothetical protein